MVVINQKAGLIKPLTVTKITSNKTSSEKKQNTLNIEPSNHQLRKENDLANLHDFVPY